MEQYEPYHNDTIFLQGCKMFCTQFLTISYRISFGHTPTNYFDQMGLLKKYRRVFPHIKSRAGRENIFKILIRDKYPPVTAYDMSKLLVELYQSYTGEENFNNIKWLYDVQHVGQHIISHIENPYKTANKQRATFQSIGRLMEAIGRHDLACEYKNVALCLFRQA